MLANKMKRKAFYQLPEATQIQLVAALKTGKWNIIVFIALVLLSIANTIIPMPFLPSAFHTFLIAMFGYIAFGMARGVLQMNKNNVSPQYIKISTAANLLLLFGLLVFVVIYASSGYVWR
jgi:hypothetical protein